MHEVLSAIWFLLPAGAANMAPIAFNRLPLLDYPVDFNLKFHGQPIFGPHKTIRGLFVGIFVGILFVYIQRLLAKRTSGYNLLDYQTYNFLLLGSLLGSGALLGDLVKSFFKRRLHIESGKSWPPFDQIDWVIGAIVFSEPAKSLNNKQIIACLILFGLLHPLSNLLGYYLRLKPNKF